MGAFTCIITILLLTGVAGRCETCPQYVTKKNFNDKARFVFVAGLEGTGHHAMKSLFGACAPLCKAAAASVSGALYKGGSNPTGVFVFGDQDIASILSQRTSFKSALKQETLDATDDTLYILNTMGGGGSGQMSYPNFSGGDKSLHHPNVHELAALAEAAGVDFRVLVLQRNSHEIRLSDVDHRHFGKEAHELAVLADNAAVLSSQLALMDPKFFVCVKYHRLNNATEWRDVTGPALHPKMANYAAEVASRSTAMTSEPKPALESLDPFELHLEAMNSILFNQCEQSAYVK